MAKRKTPKVKDLKVKADKLEEKELQDLQSLLKNIDMLHLNIGRTRSAEHDMLHRLAGLNDEVKLMQANFQDKYGDANIDVRTGTLTYENNGQADS
jgi:hypothetical protein|tara:strand:+ start:146 stop:433 length:288 start_codon:yes stop_codon:yes gene_type:complete